MEEPNWIEFYPSSYDPRFGVLYDDLKKISANDGDICISYITHELLQNKKKPYCLDIGADECWWAIFCSEHSDSATIDAFEPKLLEKSFIDYLETKFPNIHLHRKAVSNQRGFIPLFHEGPSTHSRGEGEGNELVECVTLESYLKPVETVDLVKIDTEGHEMKILEALYPFHNKIEAIIFEFTPHWYGDSIDQSMEQMCNVLPKYMDAYPYLYTVSRRGRPVLQQIEKKHIIPFMIATFENQIQLDLLLTKKPFESNHVGVFPINE